MTITRPGSCYNSRMLRTSGHQLVWLWLGLVMATPAAAQSYGDGLAAYDAGNYAETARIWGALAEEGNVMAQLGLAGLYRQGLGVAHDPSEAARLYRAAAKQGSDDAQLNLGRMHLNGEGVERDPVQAYAWLSLAAEQGRDWAEQRRRELEGRLSEDQIDEAKRRIEQLRSD